MKHVEIECITCKNKFAKKVHNQTYCTRNCRPEIQHSQLAANGVNTGTVGAIAELRISADLMSKGYEVYRALSPSSSCDILAMKGGKIITFEVRTGHYNSVTDKTYYSTQYMRADRFAIFVHHNNKIIYVPELS